MAPAARSRGRYGGVYVLYICQLGIELVEQRGPDNNKHSRLTQQWPTGGAMVRALRERRHPRGASMPPGATELPMRAKCCKAIAFVGVPIDLPVQYPWMPGQAGQGTLWETGAPRWCATATRQRCRQNPLPAHPHLPLPLINELAAGLNTAVTPVIRQFNCTGTLDSGSPKVPTPAPARRRGGGWGPCLAAQQPAQLGAALAFVSSCRQPGSMTLI